MKKFIYILFIITFIFTGCNNIQYGQAIPVLPAPTAIDTNIVESEQTNPSIPDSAKDCGPLCKEGDLEENINAGKLSEDNNMPGLEQGPEATVKEGEEKVDEPPSIPPENNAEIVLKSYESTIPDELPVSLKYNRYMVDKDYLIVLSQGVAVRERPDSLSKKVKAAAFLERFGLVALVKGKRLDLYKSDSWYKVYWQAGDEMKSGYIFSVFAEPRGFQFQKMLDSAINLKNETDKHITGYIANYKNRNGQAPAYKGKTEDAFGTDRYQSAPAYYKASLTSDFRYVSDGTLVFVIAETDSFYKIKTLNFEGDYYVPKHYVSFGPSIKTLKKVIVVDRKNQNEGVLEFSGGQWRLVSYIYATTGETAKYKQATELGYYMAIQRMGKFNYLDDITKKIAGYAPYAVRFNGGAYIHGVPVDYKIKDGLLEDPGKQEFLKTIGTIPRSHKCVRNYTSHALFIYNWIEIGSSAVIVIE